MRVGKFLSKSLPIPLRYVQPSELVPLNVVLPAVAGILLAVMVIGVFIICCVVCRYRRVVKDLKNNQDWINMITKKEAIKKKGTCYWGLVEHL